MLTAVRMISIGAASLGALVSQSTTPCGSSRSARKRGGQLVQFGAVGQAIVPEQVHDFLVADFAGEFIDVVAADR